MTKTKKEIDISGLEEMLLKYWPQIAFRVKRSLGRSTPDWEDVVSEVLLTVIKILRRQQFRGESSLGTFIYAVTSHKIIDRIREKQKCLPPLLPPPDREDNPLQCVEARERVQIVAGYLKKLKPKHADILYLHYYLDTSPREIAEIYGTSTQTMYNLIREARLNFEGLTRSLEPPAGARRGRRRR